MKKLRLARIFPSFVAVPTYLWRVMLFFVLATSCLFFAIYFLIVEEGRSRVAADSDALARQMLVRGETVLADAEEVLDGFLRQPEASCAPEKLDILQRYIAANRFVLRVGVIMAEGAVGCEVGTSDVGQLTFERDDSNAGLQVQLATIQRGSLSYPVLVKRSRDGLRAFVVLSKEAFSVIGVWSYLSELTQVDVILPDNKVWYSSTGRLVTGGFSQNPISLSLIGQSYPISVSVVVDQAAPAAWSGELGKVVFAVGQIGLIFTITAVLFVGSFIVRRRRREAQRVQEARRELKERFQYKYKPLISTAKRRLVGVYVKPDLTLFELANQQTPNPKELIERAWNDLGVFARRRREFRLFIDIDGSKLLDPDHLASTIEYLKEIGTDRLTLVVNWEPDYVLTPADYRVLERISAAGCLFAMDCTDLALNRLAEMWAWPYNTLILDFKRIADDSDSRTWISHIVTQTIEALQIDAFVIGIDDEQNMQLAEDLGFEIAAGTHLAPTMPANALLAIARPVRGQGDGGADQELSDWTPEEEAA